MIRHKFEAFDGATGRACTMMVVVQDEKSGLSHGEDCGLPADHPVHQGTPGEPLEVDDYTPSETPPIPFTYHPAWPEPGEHLWSKWFVHTGVGPGKVASKYRSCLHPDCPEIEIREARA